MKKTIDSYILGDNIGTGAYGVVRAAIDKETGEKVAIKCVHKETILKLDKRRHVMREKNILGTLNHPFIIKLITTAQVSLLTSNMVHRMMSFYTSYLRAVQMGHCST